MKIKDLDFKGQRVTARNLIDALYQLCGDNLDKPIQIFRLEKGTGEVFTDMESGQTWRNEDIVHPHAIEEVGAMDCDKNLLYITISPG